MTQEEFIERYCSRSKITREFFDRHMLAEPCTCDVEGCLGWAAKTLREALNDRDLRIHELEAELSSKVQ